MRCFKNEFKVAKPSGNLIPAFPYSREQAGILKQGRHLAIFPEGTRTRSGIPGEFKKTFAIIAAATGYPVIPVVIQGAFESAERGKKFPRRVPVTITILPPIATNGLDPAEVAEKTESAIRQAVER